MGTHQIKVNLLRTGECSPHNPDCLKTVSDLVIYQGTNAVGTDYQIRRQVVVCTWCGWVVEVRDVERDLAVFLGV